MLIELKDLRVGDEILVSSHRDFRYLRVIRPIKPKVDRKTKKVIDGRYRSVRVSANVEEISTTYTPAWAGAKPHTYISKKYHCTPEGHNKEMNVNLTYKAIWLIKRGSE